MQRGGLHFPSLGLWMDPHEPIGPGEAVVVTHAHADHTGAHAEVFLTEPTRRLMRARVAGERTEHVLPFHEDVSLRKARQGAGGDAHLALLPAGHVLGSAMAWLRANGQSLLYTGDFKLRRGLSAEPCTPRHADILVMETTFGRPQYVFPPTPDVLQAIVLFCRDALHHDEVPVLLGYSLGKSQEVLAALASEGLPIMLSEPVARLTRVYEQLGQAFPPHALLVHERAQGHVVLAPPSTPVPALRRRLGPCRVAVLTGWALDPGCRFRYQADAAFPLSDHADFPDLMEMVRQVAPRRVLTLHGFAAEFASHLRQEGFDAWALNSLEQLELSIATASPHSPRTRATPSPIPPPPTPQPAEAPERSPGGTPIPEAVETPPVAFACFADACRAIRSETSRDAKVARLGRFLASLSERHLPHAVAWFSGRALPTPEPGHGPVGWSLLRDAACEAIGCQPDAFQGSYILHGDTAATVADLWRDHPGDPLHRPTLDDVVSGLARLARETPKATRLSILSHLLRRCDAHEARHLAKILTGNLRIGLKDGLLEEAVAGAFHADPDAVRRASMVLGDLAGAACLAREGRLLDAVIQPFRPVRVMLASPERNPAAVTQRIASWPGGIARGAWAEDKHDGIRCQAHVTQGNARLYSRDLKDITAAFPEVAGALASAGLHVVLDGELLAMDGDRPLPFADLQTRIGRHEPDLFMHTDIPVALVAFDILWKGGHSLIDHPWEARRQALMAIALPIPSNLRVAHGQNVHDEASVRAAFDNARARGHEGLVIKDPAAHYHPGRRGMGWVKLKDPIATLDCVVVGAEYGHGKRSGVLSDYTFAVRDVASGQLRVLGKAYSGLTDAEIAHLTHRLLARVVRRDGPFHQVEPEVVLEIAFDRIQASSRHDSGLALRFPRIVRIRDDKGPGDCDTLESARALVSAKVSSSAAPARGA
ncbi:MAG: hypothetical protein RL153_1010 [Verrucomicrobiota bacterium]